MSQNVVPLATHPAHAPQATCRVAPIEAKWVRQADEAAAREALRFQREAPGIRAAIEAADHAVNELLERYAGAHRQHIALGLQGFRPVAPAWLYWTLLFVAALLEAPVNNSALSFLAMSEGGTWLVAGFLSVLNVLAASLFGKRLRQAAWGRPRRDWAVLAAIAVVSAGLMLSLAGMRADVIAFQGAQEQLPTSGATMPTLVLMQALFFVVGSAFSFGMVPASPLLARVLADKETLRGAVDARLRERAALAARHDRLWHEVDQAVAAHQHHCLGLVAEYRDHNMIARRTAPPPWLRRALDPAVFQPQALGPRIGPQAPALADVLARVERRVADSLPALPAAAQ